MAEEGRGAEAAIADHCRRDALSDAALYEREPFFRRPSEHEIPVRVDVHEPRCPDSATRIDRVHVLRANGVGVIWAERNDSPVLDPDVARPLRRTGPVDDPSVSDDGDSINAHEEDRCLTIFCP